MAASQLVCHHCGPLWGLDEALGAAGAHFLGLGEEGVELGADMGGARLHTVTWISVASTWEPLRTPIQAPGPTPRVPGGAQPPASTSSSAEWDPRASRRTDAGEASECAQLLRLVKTVHRPHLYPCPALNGRPSCTGRVGTGGDRKGTGRGWAGATRVKSRVQNPPPQRPSCVILSKSVSLSGVRFLTCGKGVTTLSPPTPCTNTSHGRRHCCWWGASVLRSAVHRAAPGCAP